MVMVIGIVMVMVMFVMKFVVIVVIAVKYSALIVPPRTGLQQALGAWFVCVMDVLQT